MISLTPCRCLGLLFAVFAVFAAAVATGGLRAQDAPEAVPSPRPPVAGTPSGSRSKYAAIQNELAMYSPFESPWADLKANHAFESHLFNLLRAETRLWALQDELTTQNSPAREDAADISSIVHAQVLGEAAEALPLLQKTPNRPFAVLLVHQLEAYPYEWKEEGSEQLLPGLHQLIDPKTGNPTPGEGHRRRRRHVPDDGGGQVSPAPATRPGTP